MQTFKTTPFGFRPWRLMLASLVLAVAGGLAQTAAAAPPEGPPPGMGPGPQGMHPAMRPGMQRDMHPGHEMAGGDARFLGRMLDLAKATPEQRSQIRQIMLAARQDLQAQREAGRHLRDQQHALLTQPSVDAAAVEALRQQMLAQHDQASKRMTQALMEASRVLTPEQRKLIGEHRAMLERHRAERQALESRR
jgi:Spy/CpxP family protein refolding chaperone